MGQDRQRRQRLEAAQRVGRSHQAGSTERDDGIRPRLGRQRHGPPDPGDPGRVRGRPPRHGPRNELQKDEDDTEQGQRRPDLESE